MDSRTRLRSELAATCILDDVCVKIVENGFQVCTLGWNAIHGKASAQRLKLASISGWPAPLVACAAPPR
jgi:hypothetical protein